MHTAVVISSFGRHVLMQQTLNTLFATIEDTNAIKVIVVDNGSPQSTLDVLAAYRDRLFALVLLNENKGKPYALNLGAHIATEDCYAQKSAPPDYFLFCDNDLKFHPHWHQKMLAAYKEHENLPLCALSGFKWHGHALTGLKTGPTTQVNVVPYPPGCCVMMSQRAFRANGLWDTRRLIRTVDTSYMRNAIRRGYLNASIHPETVIEHTGIKERCWDLATGAPKLLP